MVVFTSHSSEPHTINLQAPGKTWHGPEPKEILEEPGNSVSKPFFLQIHLKFRRINPDKPILIDDISSLDSWCEQLANSIHHVVHDWCKVPHCFIILFHHALFLKLQELSLLERPHTTNTSIPGTWCVFAGCNSLAASFRLWGPMMFPDLRWGTPPSHCWKKHCARFGVKYKWTSENKKHIEVGCLQPSSKKAVFMMRLIMLACKICEQYLTGWWFEPLWKIWVRQLGWLFPIYGK